MTDAIKEDAMLIPTEQHLYLRVDLTCPSEDYTAFIDDLRRKLADHPGKTVVHDCPVLAKQRRRKPTRFMLINLEGYFDEKITVAVRGDTLDLIGFKTQNGCWYEFSIPKKVDLKGHTRSLLRMSEPVLTGSTYLGCDSSYQSLLGDRYFLHELKLGRMSMINAIHTLGGYQQQEGQIINQDTKLALALLMVMICESARFAEIQKTVKDGWYNGTTITEQQVQYTHNWVELSSFLSGGRRRLSLQSRMGDIGIVEEKDAAKLVQLVYNPLQPLVEVLHVRAASRFCDTISLFDKEDGEVIIYDNKNHQSYVEGNASSQVRIRMNIL